MTYANCQELCVLLKVDTPLWNGSHERKSGHSVAATYKCFRRAL